MTTQADRAGTRPGRPVRPIVVGVSDDHQGAAAVRAGAHLAQESRVPLHLVHVWRDVEWFYSAPAAAFGELIADRQREQGMLNDAASEARRIALDVPVTAEFVAGNVFEVLRKRSRGAHALVLGGTRHPEPDSIVAWMIKNVHCPVLVVDSAGRVVAGSRQFAAAQS
jgi:nucleotide-binding universal stress UspA family protein